jgi:hypothetical protein
MGQPRGGITACGALDSPTDTEGCNCGLSNDGTNLAGCGRETVGCGTVAGGEAFAGDNEGCCVRSEVEEELGEDIERKEGVAREFVIGKSEDAEEYCLRLC